MATINEFSAQLAKINDILIPQVVNKRKVVPAYFTREVVTIVGVKTAKSRFLPVSHEGYSNETYIDKVELLGKLRAEFIARKLKGIERRAHMSLFRELVEISNGTEWKTFFEQKFNNKACTVPDNLCIACWNCSLFGGLEAGRVGTFSRIRYFDTYSIEDALDCVATMDSEEGMGIGNQIYEDLAKQRGAETYHLYEYVKPGVHFPFITMIESPTLLDVAGLISAIKRADEHGYGKYSTNHGKFDSEFLAVSTGYPRFSILDLLKWADEDGIDGLKAKFDANDPKAKFDALNKEVTIFGNENILEIADENLKTEFKKYLDALE